MFGHFYHIFDSANFGMSMTPEHPVLRKKPKICIEHASICRDDARCKIVDGQVELRSCTLAADGT